MKQSLWKTVKVHQWLIYPREDIGVVKAEVVEVDIKVATLLPTFHYDYPYGLTRNTGTVRIKYEVDKIPKTDVETLTNLIAYNPSIFQMLSKAYMDWQEAQETADMFRQAFNNVVGKIWVE
jgi:hypothetical protein